MAGIDHTCICYHNGKLLKETHHCDFVERETAWVLSNGEIHTTTEIVDTVNVVDLLPFSTTRDGLFQSDSTISIDNMNRLFPEVYFKSERKEQRVIRAWDKCPWKTEDKYPEQNFNNIIYWYKNDTKLIISQSTEQYCLTYYFKLDTNDSWVVLGGYGHFDNPYTHFYHRGYGEDFEKKMAYEAYRWICGDLLPERLDDCLGDLLENDEEYCMGPEHTEFYKTLAKMLHFKNYWSMINTDEERDEYANTDSMEYDPESIFPESKTITVEPSEEFKRLVEEL